MQYNTQQKRMPLPEYGRSIQNMVDFEPQSAVKRLRTPMRIL